MWWGLLMLTFVGASAAFLWESVVVRRAEGRLPLLGDVQDFALTDQDHRPLTRQTLLGSTWVADFIYTECGSQCPRMSRQMARIQSLLPKESTMKLLSISVDPEHDTPEVLARYAQRYGADPTRWWFATGSSDTLHRLAENFKLAPRGPSAESFTLNHSNRLILVDSGSHIRGYYEGTDDQAVQQLIKDMSSLAAKDVGP